MADFSGNNSLSTLNGNFKEVYADKIQNLIPDGMKLTKMVPFIEKSKEHGNLYHQPVVLGLEHGVTFASSSESAFALNNAVAGQIKDAQVDASQLLLRSVMGYGPASRAAKSRNAFIDSTQFLIENMVRSVSKKLEVILLYGGVGIGKVNADTTAAVTFVVKLSEWAPGIWAGAENMEVDFCTDGTTTVTNTGVISSVNMSTRTVTLTAAKSLTALDDIYFKGAAGKEMAGLHKILSNTGSLFNISAATYSLWKSNSYAAGSAALTLAKIQSAVTLAVEKGLEEDVICMINPNAWKNLLTDEAALVQHVNQMKGGKVERGAESIKFFSQNGSIEIVPSIYVKEGYSYIFAPKMFKRLGSTDVTFKVPGRDDEFFLHLAANAGFELRCYTEQALFCEAPGKQCVITGIVNS